MRFLQEPHSFPRESCNVFLPMSEMALFSNFQRESQDPAKPWKHMKWWSKGLQKPFITMLYKLRTIFKRYGGFQKGCKRSSKAFSTKLSKGLQKPLVRCFKSRATFLIGTLAFKRGAKGLQTPLVRCFKSCATFLKGMVAFKGLSKGSQKHFQKVPQVATRVRKILNLIWRLEHASLMDCTYLTTI